MWLVCISITNTENGSLHPLATPAVPWYHPSPRAGVKTVRNYLLQVYRKLIVHPRTQAALLYQEATHKSEPA